MPMKHWPLSSMIFPAVNLHLSSGISQLATFDDMEGYTGIGDSLRKIQKWFWSSNECWGVAVWIQIIDNVLWC